MALSVRYERDGLVLPRAIGGDAALDLVNTFAGWDRPSAASTRDYLQSYEHLVLWSASVGMVAEADVGSLRRAGRRKPAAADEALHRAKQLRTAVHDLLLDSAGTPSDVALETGIADRLALIVNRANSGVSVADMERTVGMPALALIRSGGLLLVKAANMGRTVIDLYPRERITEDFNALAERLVLPGAVAAATERAPGGPAAARAALKLLVRGKDTVRA